MLSAVRLALRTYADPPAWREMMRAGMRRDYSWEHAASEYAALYRQMLS